MSVARAEKHASSIANRTKEILTFGALTVVTSGILAVKKMLDRRADARAIAWKEDVKQTYQKKFDDEVAARYNERFQEIIDAEDFSQGFTE